MSHAGVGTTASPLSPLVQKAMVWCGHVVVIAIAVGMLIAGFIPPPLPSAPAEVIATMYAQRQGPILVGCALMMAFWVLWVPWGSLVAMYIKRTQHAAYPALTNSAVACVGAGLVIFEFIPFFWAVAAFRSGQVDPQITLTLNDIAWFMYLYPWPPFALLFVITGIAVLTDHNRPRIFPRWLAYFSFWGAIGLTPAMLMSFFKYGAFGYNGLIGMWTPLIVFCIWMEVVSALMTKAIDRDRRRHLGEHAGEETTGRPPSMPPTTAVTGPSQTS